MAEQHEVDVKINPDGTVDINLIGYKGEACEAELKKIAKQIGLILQSKKKSEYYDENKVQIKTNAE